MANVKTIGGAIVNTGGSPLPSKTVTLKNDDTGATITTTTTNADGEWEFANRDETIRYRAEAAFGGSSSQVVVRKPASAEFDHLYANLSFRTAAAATVALGGALTVAGGLTISSGNLAVTTGDVTISAGDLALTMGGITTQGGIAATGSISTDGGLTVAGGDAIFGAAVTIAGDLDVTGVTTLDDNVTVGGTLGVSAQATFSSTVSVGGDLTAQQALVVLDTASVANGLTANGLTVVSGPTSLGGSVAVGTTLTVNSRPVIMAGARVYHNANQNVSNTTVTPLAMNAERFDTDAFHDTATNNTRLTVPAGLGGVYLIWGHIEIAANTTGVRELSIAINGGTRIILNSQVASGAGTLHYLTVSTIYSLAAGDYVELRLYQSSGGTLAVNSSANYSPEFGLQRIG